MIIQNFEELTHTKERRDALEIINTGIEAVLTKPAMKRQIKVASGKLSIGKESWDVKKFRNVYVVGAGKAATDMAEAIEEIFGNLITEGIVIDTREKKLSKIHVKLGTHPLPSQANIDATNEIISMLKKADANDLVIALISGGGSALMESPKITLNALIEMNKLLLKSGANIHEINTVRKHVSKIKGGRLAELAYPATLLTIVVSDVMGNNIDVIASGPAVMDKTSNQDAEKIRKKYNLPELPFSETPKDKKLFSKTNTYLVVTNVLAANAMKEKAAKLGYNAKIVATELTGEARKVGADLAKKLKQGTALIATGETTVVVKGTGKGGRNQELALGASLFLKEGVVASCGSDGVDFIVEAAGGITDQDTAHHAAKQGININKYLDNNDSYAALSKLSGIIVTGKTGTNVGDLMVALSSARAMPGRVGGLNRQNVKKTSKSKSSNNKTKTSKFKVKKK